MKSSVCYFGSYESKYSRNEIIIKGLKVNNFKVYECNFKGNIINRYFYLTKSFLKKEKDFGYIIVGFPGWFDMPLAFILGKIFRKKIIFDVFTPLYETYYLDRRQVKVGEFYYLIDYLNFKMADIVLADTNAHLLSYQEKYQLKKGKEVIVYVGSDDNFFYPRNLRISNDVLFYGSYQPLQGVENIIKIANRLPNIKFKLIGRGQTKNKVLKLTKNLKLKNVEFVDWLLKDDLAIEINKSKIILGIFGNSLKSNLVIPNKVYDGLACKKVVITKRTKASLELPKDSCILVEDIEELESEIKALIKNKKRRDKVAMIGYKFYKNSLRPKEVVRPLINILNE